MQLRRSQFLSAKDHREPDILHMNLTVSSSGSWPAGEEIALMYLTWKFEFVNGL